MLAMLYEMTDYNKLVRDTKNRNCVFFDKINIPRAK
jgi:hypothetical protein